MQTTDQRPLTKHIFKTSKGENLYYEKTDNIPGCIIHCSIYCIHGVPCSVEEASKVLAERAKAGILPREPRKGFYKLYTDHALSAMKGAGLE